MRRSASHQLRDAAGRARGETGARRAGGRRRRAQCRRRVRRAQRRRARRRVRRAQRRRARLRRARLLRRRQRAAAGDSGDGGGRTLVDQHRNGVARVHPEHVFHLVGHLEGEALADDDDPRLVVLFVHRLLHEPRRRLEVVCVFLDRRDDEVGAVLPHLFRHVAILNERIVHHLLHLLHRGILDVLHRALSRGARTIYHGTMMVLVLELVLQRAHINQFAARRNRGGEERVAEPDCGVANGPCSRAHRSQAAAEPCPGRV